MMYLNDRAILELNEKVEKLSRRVEELELSGRRLLLALAREPERLREYEKEAIIVFNKE